VNRAAIVARRATPEGLEANRAASAARRAIPEGRLTLSYAMTKIKAQSQSLEWSLKDIRSSQQIC
jgi:hypothetical protein